MEGIGISSGAFSQCHKCQSYVNSEILPIHNNFCMGTALNFTGYTDEQVYELGRVIQDYNLLEFDWFTDFTSEEYLPQENNMVPEEENDHERYQCDQCEDYIQYSEYLNHQQECRNQGVKCNYCSVYFPYELIQQHSHSCEKSQQKQQQQFQQQQSQQTQQQQQSQQQFYHSLKENEDSIKDYLTTDGKDDDNISITYTSQFFNAEEHQQTGRAYSSRYQTQDSGIREHTNKSSKSNRSNISITNRTSRSNQKPYGNITHASQDRNHQLHITEFNNLMNQNDWLSLSPEQFTKALEIIFPSFKGERDLFKKNQHQRFRQNLITRLANIASSGIGGEKESSAQGSDTKDNLGFQKMKYNSMLNSEDKLCSICMCDYDEGEELLMLDCSHRYHIECISKWLEKKTTCPICKRDIREFV